MSDLYIKNGKRVDGQPVEVLINNGKIEKVGPQLINVKADKTIDLHGESYVSAGWIDDHTHCYEKLTLYYDDPDEDGYSHGVTTVIDAGSTGADNIGDFYDRTRSKKTNVFAMLNVSRTGILAQDELGDLSRINEQAFADALAKYPDFIVGLKARMSKSVVVGSGITPLKDAKQFQKDNEHLPLMVHVGSNPPELEEILSLMEDGDILTHAYNGKPNGILDEYGNIKDFVFDAYSRGVIFDTGHGTDSFNFHTATVARRSGLIPKSISTDIYHRNRENGPVYDMPTCLEKMLMIGYTLPEIIPMVTSAPAENFHLTHKGQLRPGYDADITIFKTKTGNKTMTDSNHNEQTATELVLPETTVINGHVYDIEKEQ